MMNEPRPPTPIDNVDATAIATFLVDALALMRHPHHLVDLCSLLTTRADEVLPITGAAVVLTDGSGRPTIASAFGASEARRRVLETELDHVVHDCLRTGKPLSRDISIGDERSAVHVLPIASHDTVFGVLALLADRPLTEARLQMAVVLTDVVGVAFLQASPHLMSASMGARFTDLLRSLDLVDQAKGFLAQRHGSSIDAASDGLWQTALSHGLGLTALAEQVVSRTLDDELTESLTRAVTSPASAPIE